MRGRSRVIERQYVEEDEGSGRKYWDDEEEDKMARRLLALQRATPDASLVSLGRQAQVDVLPEDRHRTINTAKAIKLVIDRMRAIAADEQKALARIPELERQIDQLRLNLQAKQADLEAIPKKDDILASLSIGEVVQRFGPLVLANTSLDDFLKLHPNEDLLATLPLPKVAAYAVENFVALMQANTTDVLDHLTSTPAPPPVPQPSTNGTHHANGHAKPAAPKLPRVLVIGPKGDQGDQLQRRLLGKCLISVHNRERADMPGNYDLYVLWTRFVSHHHQEAVKAVAADRLVLYTGGLDRMAAKVVDAITARRL